MITLNVNNQEHQLEIEPHGTLIDVLQKKMGLMGVRLSCGQGECGACTILLNGKPALACMMLAHQAEGKKVLTIEGLGSYDDLHPIQEAFIEEHGFQCGFCTPGIILSTKNLLDSKPNSGPQDIAEALSGHICRCGAYPKIIKSVQKAAKKIEDYDG
ncbi:MAG: (2Fe-2S)-binding protein [Deltaproteobacteria bacterium]|jgi:aerobic-type carbon monoxide dehydrogenase small subunit (CoxS/CutS family)|nr:(2Fe-2S)-binding protein [Deltaproteobacteria bacterium]